MTKFDQFLESEGFQADACEATTHPDFFRLARRLWTDRNLLTTRLEDSHAEASRLRARVAELEGHAAALAAALEGYQEDCGEGHPRPCYDCPTCGAEETILAAYREFLSR